MHNNNSGNEITNQPHPSAVAKTSFILPSNHVNTCQPHAVAPVSLSRPLVPCVRKTTRAVTVTSTPQEGTMLARANYTGPGIFTRRNTQDATRNTS